MSTEQQQQKATPGWATQIGVGMYAAALGIVLVGLGTATGGTGFIGIGSLLTALGAAVALIGGGTYFMKIRR